jgi:hypothetical protein
MPDDLDKATRREETRVGQVINNVIDIIKDPVGTVRDWWRDRTAIAKVTEAMTADLKRSGEWQKPAGDRTVPAEAWKSYERYLDDVHQGQSLESAWDAHEKRMGTGIEPGLAPDQYVRTDNGSELRLVSDRTDAEPVARAISDNHEMMLSAGGPSPTQAIAAATQSHVMAEMREENEATGQQADLFGKYSYRDSPEPKPGWTVHAERDDDEMER